MNCMVAVKSSCMFNRCQVFIIELIWTSSRKSQKPLTNVRPTNWFELRHENQRPLLQTHGLRIDLNFVTKIIDTPCKRMAYELISTSLRKSQTPLANACGSFFAVSRPSTRYAYVGLFDDYTDCFSAECCNSSGNVWISHRAVYFFHPHWGEFLLRQEFCVRSGQSPVLPQSV